VGALESENSEIDPWKIHAFNFNLESAEIEKPAGDKMLCSFVWRIAELFFCRGKKSFSLQ
jgi:hypothetical protein